MFASYLFGLPYMYFLSRPGLVSTLTKILDHTKEVIWKERKFEFRQGALVRVRSSMKRFLCFCGQHNCFLIDFPPS